MPPLRTAALCAVLSCLSLAAVAGPEVESSARESGPAVPAMAEAVAAFFSPQNTNPMPSEMNRVLRALQDVGRQGGPTREQLQPVIDRVKLAADEFAPAEPTEQEPAPGVASSVKLELLAGPFRAWLNADQKDAILRKQREYGAKLTVEDRHRLQSKMLAWAHALGGAALGANLQGSAVAAAAVDAGGPSSASGAGKVLLSLAPAAPRAAAQQEPPALDKAEKAAPKLFDSVVLKHGDIFDGGYRLESRPDGTILVGDHLGFLKYALLRKAPGLTPTIVIRNSDGRVNTIPLDADRDYFMDSALGQPSQWSVATTFFTRPGKKFTVDSGARFSIEMLPDTRPAQRRIKATAGAAAALGLVAAIAGFFGGSMAAFTAVGTAVQVGFGLLLAYWGYQSLRRAPGKASQLLRATGALAGLLTMLIGLGFAATALGFLR